MIQTLQNNLELQNAFAPGKHILLDLWGSKNLTDQDLIKNTLTEAAKSCNATILESNFHSFGENCGITGVLILAESHISIHTWPEIDFCAIDIFMCGNCNAENAIKPILDSFQPSTYKSHIQTRGEILDEKRK